jgi:hypothetical protein
MFCSAIARELFRRTFSQPRLGMSAGLEALVAAGVAPGVVLIG